VLFFVCWLALRGRFSNDMFLTILFACVARHVPFESCLVAAFVSFLSLIKLRQMMTGLALLLLWCTPASEKQHKLDTRQY
jgi:hypothetical protein